ncbi:alpha/beta fold hydrolase [Undibacterium oligocarboniphilum]|uniref:Alpha/beta hydrolase n=1 Tax=Undibacterium oligocarboniphilum TaxID=666702 RepID=A0A850QGP6_9BURK|nr:alpha/beta hydrolase [Undibacterium oligocarboniphilum]MBC3870833.1 alpha/beta hydrolase [Undibacterium oligocarboniphilum]NVO76543.1 alpha/beta hydrolase [Undibacterium oligocarboniphilum]
MTWVLLRGLMREQRHWGSFTQQFAQAHPHERIITLDFAGNGALYQQASATSIGAMVEQARGQLQQKQIEGNIKLLAISLGGMVAVAWAERYPHELQRLVLINTSLAPHNPFYQRLRPANYPTIISTMLTGTQRQREQLILRLTSHQSDTANAERLLDDWISYAQQYPIRRHNILRQLVAAMRYRAPAQAPQVPLLMLAGAKDALVNPQCSTTLATRWQTELRIHPDAGHDLPLDDPDWVIRQTLG